jgi:hypothetical protein
MSEEKEICKAPGMTRTIDSLFNDSDVFIGPASKQIKLGSHYHLLCTIIESWGLAERTSCRILTSSCMEVKKIAAQSRTTKRSLSLYERFFPSVR